MLVLVLVVSELKFCVSVSVGVSCQRSCFTVVLELECRVSVSVGVSCQRSVLG